jgi:cytochrome c oxidase cbb3-type subunit III
VGMTDEEIWQIIAYLRRVQVRAPSKQLGNTANGKQLFYGDANCSTCHMVEGKGGRVGPDLTSVGISRTVESLVESVRNPSQQLAWGLTEPTKEFAQRYETVAVVTPEGKEIKGVTLNEDNFSLQVMDTTERIYVFDKDKLRSITKSRKSLMPSYAVGTLSNQDLNDIIAYLIDVAEK